MERGARWYRLLWVGSTALMLSACLILPGKGRTWSLWLLFKYGQNNAYSTAYLKELQPALAVGKEAEIEASFEPHGCKVELAVMGGGPVAQCLDNARGDRSLTVTASSAGPAFSVTTSGNKVRVRALAEGKAELKITARNRKGEQHSETVPLRAAAPAKLGVQLYPNGGGNPVEGCIDGRKPARLWFEVGKSFLLSYAVLSRDEPRPFLVVGVPAGVVAKGSAGFKQNSYDELRTSGNLPGSARGSYVMTEPGTFELTSSTVPSFNLTGGAFRCQDLTGLAFRDVVRTPSEAVFDLAPMVGDDPVCAKLTGCPVQARVETPGICEVVRMDGKSTGEVAGEGQQRLVRRAAGTCRVTATIPGTSLAGKLEVEFAELPASAKSAG